MKFRIIELIIYGDFDVPITNSVWIGGVDLPVPDLSKFRKSNDISAARVYLVALGYICANTLKFEIGGDL